MDYFLYFIGGSTCLIGLIFSFWSIVDTNKKFKEFKKNHG